MAKKRSIKVYGQSGYKYQETPTIMLKGMWLKELGFEIGDYISVVCEDGKLIITPDTERAELEKAEAEIMEKEEESCLSGGWLRVRLSTVPVQMNRRQIWEESF